MRDVAFSVWHFAENDDCFCSSEMSLMEHKKLFMFSRLKDFFRDFEKQGLGDPDRPRG